jgi:putative transcription factor
LLSVCPSCAKFGKEVSPAAQKAPDTHPVVADRLEQRARRMSTRDVLSEMEGGEDIAADLPARVRNARNAKGWRQDQLASKINEKASVVAKLETGALVPNDALVKKLERALGVKLREKVERTEAKKYTGPSTMTLGDLLELDER